MGAIIGFFRQHARYPVSAPPLAAEAASLIEKEILTMWFLMMVWRLLLTLRVQE
jgi:hypothetical protein